MYSLEIGAPGFQTIQRTVQITGTSAGCSSCGTVDTQHLDIELVPT